MPKSISDAIKEAVNAGKQPLCPYCHAPLEVREMQTIALTWRWNPFQKNYVKTQDEGYSEKPECARCGVKDWEFTNNGVIKY